MDIDPLKISKKTLKLNTLSDMLVVLYGKKAKKRRRKKAKKDSRLQK